MFILVVLVSILSQTPTPTPYPTPSYDPASYLAAVRSGKTVTVRGANLADKIQAAQDDPTVSSAARPI